MQTKIRALEVPARSNRRRILISSIKFAHTHTLLCVLFFAHSLPPRSSPSPSPPARCFRNAKICANLLRTHNHARTLRKPPRRVALSIKSVFALLLFLSLSLSLFRTPKIRRVCVDTILNDVHDDSKKKVGFARVCVCSNKQAFICACESKPSAELVFLIEFSSSSKKCRQKNAMKKWTNELGSS